jgi:hypothetical protein
MIFDIFGINVFHGGETIQGRRIHRPRHGGSRFFSNTGAGGDFTTATEGCDEFDLPETSYPLKAIGGQPRNPA